MNPVVKYSLARLGLFVAVAALFAAVPVPLNVYIKLAVAVLVSAGLSLFLLRGMRDQVVDFWAANARKRADEKARLRAALAGDDADADDSEHVTDDPRGDYDGRGRDERGRDEERAGGAGGANPDGADAGR